MGYKNGHHHHQLSLLTSDCFQTKRWGQSQTLVVLIESFVRISFAYSNLHDNYDKLHYANPRGRNAAAGEVGNSRLHSHV